MWRLFATGVGIGTAIVTRRVLRRIWRRYRGGASSRSPAGRHTPFRDAAVFAAVSGVTGVFTRRVSDRVAAEAWRKVRGSYPPGMNGGRRRSPRLARG
jgi:hypothetical protein